MRNPVHQAVMWEKGPDDRVAWKATVDGEQWAVEVLRRGLGPRYTLLVNGQVAAELDAWPREWKLPKTAQETGEDLSCDEIYRRDFEMEMEKAKRQMQIPPSKLVDDDD